MFAMSRHVERGGGRFRGGVLVLTLALLLAGAGAQGAIMYEYNAGLEADAGANAAWEPNINATAAHGGPYTRNPKLAANVTYNNSPATSYSGITASYAFPGTTNYQGTLGAGSTLAYGKTQLPLGGTATNDVGASSSWELWIRPDRTAWDDVGDEVLLESGGTTNGMHIQFLADAGQAKLRFRTRRKTKQGNQPASNVDATITLTDDSLLGDFIQIVGVVDAGDESDETAADAANEKTILYINGGTASGGLQLQVTGFADWQDGNSDAAFAGINKAGGGGAVTTGGDSANFVGDMAIVRIYDSPLTAAEVAASYEAVIPEPATLGLLAIGSLAILACRKRRRT